MLVQLVQDADFEEVFICSAIVSADQHSAAATSKSRPELRRSRGGQKILSLVKEWDSWLDSATLSMKSLTAFKRYRRKVRHGLNLAPNK